MCWINDVLMNVILYVLILPSTKSLDNEDYVHLLITALYMADDEGKCVLLDKALPPSIEAIIREHALSLLNPSTRTKAMIKVVPRPPHLHPFNPNPNIFRVDLRENSSRKHFMSNMWNDLKNFWDHKILGKGTNTKKKTKLSENKKNNAPILKATMHILDNVTDAGGNYTIVTDSTNGTQKMVGNTTEEKNAGVTTAGDGIVTTVKPSAIENVPRINTIKETNDSEESWLENPKPTSDGEKLNRDQATKHYNYIPTDIYYSIEKKCVNWSDACQLKLPSILEQPSSSFKFNSGFLAKPKNNLWNY